MKVRSAVRRICRDCYVVKKKRVVYIRCKSTKKHKQRQGFHTEAGLSTAWQEGEGQEVQAHGLGACSEDATTRLATAAAPWAAGPLRAASSGDSSPGALASLPWLPAWASVPPPAAVGGDNATTAVSPVVAAASPLRKLGDWLASSLFSAVRKSGP